MKDNRNTEKKEVKALNTPKFNVEGIEKLETRYEMKKLPFTAADFRQTPEIFSGTALMIE